MVNRIRWLWRERRAGSLPTSTAASVAPLVHCCGKQNQVVEEGGGQAACHHQQTISNSLVYILLWPVGSFTTSTAPSVASLVHCCGKQNQVVEEGWGQTVCQHPQRQQQCPRFTAVVVSRLGYSAGWGTGSFPPSTTPWVASCSLLWWAVPDVVEGVGHVAYYPPQQQHPQFTVLLSRIWWCRRKDPPIFTNSIFKQLWKYGN